MPTLKLDQFDDAPKVGDKVKVTGKVKSINEDSGDVEISYDDVSIVGKESKDNTDFPDEVIPESQSFDDALNEAFNKTQ